MAERDSLWVNSNLDQEEARVGIGAFVTPATTAVKAKSGLRPSSGNPGVVAASGTPDANVTVQPFQAFLQSSRGATSGIYVMTLDSVKTINVLSTPAHASLARNDLIVAHQSDTFYGDGSSAMLVRQVVGTPSGSPSDPSLASFPDSITLARVRVNANATSINSGNITDLRPSWTVAVGGLLPVASATIRNALTGLYEGFQIFRTDRDWVEVFDGSAWRVQGTAAVANTADLTAITNPYGGQTASASNGLQDWTYTGSAWLCTRYRAVTTLSSTTASVTFSSIPTTLKQLTLTWIARSTTASFAQALRVRVNGDTGANYSFSYTQVAGTSAFQTVLSSQTSWLGGVIAGNSAAASNFGAGVIDFPTWSRSPNLNAVWRNNFYESGSNSWSHHGGGLHFAAGSNTSITLFPDSGSFTAGSEFLLTGSD